MHVFFSDHYTLPLPEDHKFPMSKYRMLRDYLLENEIITRAQMYESPLASEELLRLAHTEHYIKAMKTGNIDLLLELVF